MVELLIFVVALVVGVLGSMLGIGGIIEVPIMRLTMGMPLRAAIGTSNFMIGVTAATSAVIYYQRGLLGPTIAIPTAPGVLGNDAGYAWGQNQPLSQQP